MAKNKQKKRESGIYLDLRHNYSKKLTTKKKSEEGKIEDFFLSKFRKETKNCNL